MSSNRAAQGGRLALWLALALLCAGNRAHAQETASAPSSVEWLPGDARHITHATSGSRDTAVFEAIVAPRLSVTLGSEFGLLDWRVRGVSLRPGLFALFGLESRRPTTQLFPAPGGDSDLWRGIIGYEATCSFERWAQALFGEQGTLELALGYYHESEHHTASNKPVTPTTKPEHPELRGRPQIDNFVMIDEALRALLGSFELVVREQTKIFTNGQDQTAPFRWGVGGDLIVRARIWEQVQPFSASFAELLQSNRAKDARSFRSLLGVAFPGRFGELSVYVSFDAGAQKGLLIPENRTAFGGGVRYSPFRM